MAVVTISVIPLGFPILKSIGGGDQFPRVEGLRPFNGDMKLVDCSRDRCGADTCSRLVGLHIQCGPHMEGKAHLGPGPDNSAHFCRVGLQSLSFLCLITYSCVRNLLEIIPPII